MVGDRGVMDLPTAGYALTRGGVMLGRLPSMGDRLWPEVMGKEGVAPREVGPMEDGVGGETKWPAFP